jgi:hypothetical protein
MWWSYLPQALYSLTTPFSNILASSFFPYGERLNFVHREQEIREKITTIYCMLWFQEIPGALVEMALAALAAVRRRHSAPAQTFLSSNNLTIYITNTFKHIHIFVNYIISRPMDGT